MQQHEQLERNTSKPNSAASEPRTSQEDEDISCSLDKAALMAYLLS